jgi:membrane-associated phospholipid phosphatase
MWLANAGRYAGEIRWPLCAYVPLAVAFARKRRSLRTPQPLSLVVVGGAPLAMATALPPGAARRVAVWLTHMWAYKIAFEIPHDRPAKQRERLHIDYPIRWDSRLGGGEPPVAQMQRRLRRPPALSWLDRLAALLYFTWELEPHAALGWILVRHPERFPAAAARLAATFDLTLLGYFCAPTAPPWWASEREGRMDRGVRRVVAEVGKELRGKPRPGIDHNPGANPWAAMPSDHFATAAAAAMLLAEVDSRAGVLGWAYAIALGGVLVYTGEHYVTDVIAGLVLAVAVRVLTPRAAAQARRGAEPLSR